METGCVTLKNLTTGQVIPARCDLTDRQRKILLAGGLLNYTKENSL
jgi:aconitate hydratase